MKTTQETTPKQAATHRQFQGIVVATSEDKTVRVLVKTQKMHKKYQKQYTVSKKYPVHDEKGVASVGDHVLFEECRPLSKTKHWRLLQVIS